MSSPERFEIPILGKLVPSGIKAGTIFTVEYDPESQWFAVAATMAAQYLRTNGRVAFAAFTRPPETVKGELASLGVDVSQVTKEGRLLVYDWYSASLTSGRLDSGGGRPGALWEPIEGGVRMRSLKVADLSVQWLKDAKYGPQPEDVEETWPPGALSIWDSCSAILRFNDEREFLEYTEARVMPIERKAKRINLWGLIRGIHSEMYYRRNESVSDGVIDVRVMERNDEAKNLLRVRSLKGQSHDARWHEIEIKENGEASLTN